MFSRNRIEIAAWVESKNINLLPSSDRVANLRLKVVETYKDRNGQPKTTVMWINASAWNGQVAIAEKLEPGDCVLISGKLIHRSWQDAEGVTQKRHEITAFEIVPLPDGSLPSDPAAAEQPKQQPVAATATAVPARNGKGKKAKPAEQLPDTTTEDEIPY